MLTPMLSILQVISSSYVFSIFGILDFISICVHYILVYRIVASYGLLHYQDYVPNIALTTANGFY